MKDRDDEILRADGSTVAWERKQEQGARSRNAGPSVARTVPLVVYSDVAEPDGMKEIVVKFNVSKAELLAGLQFIKESNSEEQRQARVRGLFSRLIATSHK